MNTTDRPEPDRIEGAPHPRDTARIFGQTSAVDTFLTAYGSGRLHHGWLLSGPRGVGKATLAWQMARFLLATPEAGSDDMFGAPPAPTSLDIAADHPVSRRMAALSEPGLYVVRRGYDDKAKRLKTQLTVDEVRGLRNFFALSAADGGRRVVIVDAADDMNPNAANAILKLLEEPPARTILLLVCHQPARLLPTIRSRCRALRLSSLGPQDMAQALDQAGAEIDPSQAAPLATLSAGSVGAAISLLQQDGIKLYSDVLGLLDSLPRLDRSRAIALAESCAGKAREPRLDLALTLIDVALARAARTGVTGVPPEPQAAQSEAQILTRVSPDAAAGRAWAALAQSSGDRARHARGVNVDPAALMLDLFLGLSAKAPTA